MSNTEGAREGSGGAIPHEDADVFTKFETEEGPCGQESPEGRPIWGAYCPQEDCDELNRFQGDPSEFANRPYRCQECGWVSLMHESVADLEVGSDGFE